MEFLYSIWEAFNNMLLFDLEISSILDSEFAFVFQRNTGMF